MAPDLARYTPAKKSLQTSPKSNPIHDLKRSDGSLEGGTSAALKHDFKTLIDPCFAIFIMNASKNNTAVL